MATDALAVRIAHLEGAYEQIDKRLGSLDGRTASLERKVDEGFTQLRHELSQRIDRVAEKLDITFRWVIGIILINWITLMLAILLRR
jgi:tetrahydromethanopterin S-methyltransferase subunit G